MKQHYTTAQAAEQLDVSQRTIQQWLKEGKRFPNARQLDPSAYKSPYVIPASDIEAERQRQQAAK